MPEVSLRWMLNSLDEQEFQATLTAQHSWAKHACILLLFSADKSWVHPFNQIQPCGLPLFRYSSARLGHRTIHSKATKPNQVTHIRLLLLSLFSSSQRQSQSERLRERERGKGKVETHTLCLYVCEAKGLSSLALCNTVRRQCRESA